MIVTNISCTKEREVEIDLPHDNYSFTSILILGNSITIHPPLDSVRWKGNWGMAASSRDKDFVHIITRYFSNNPSISVRFGNIADFERTYDSYDFSKLDTFRNLHSDLIIMRIAENVVDETSVSKGFIKKYDKLLLYLDPSSSAKKIITEGFWNNANTNLLLKNYALEKNFPFVALSDLSSNSLNEAYGLFEDNGVQSHPGDTGMQQIAHRIIDCINSNF